MAKSLHIHFLMDETSEGWGGQWFWPNRIPHKKVTIVSANWGSGKTRTFASIFSAWHKHEEFPDGTYSDIEPGKVLIFTTESEDDELISIFKVHGLDAEEIHTNVSVTTGVELDNGLKEPFDIDAHLQYLEDKLATLRPTIVLWDPLVEFHHRKEIDSHQIRSLMILLNTLCQKYNCTMICMLHWNKNEKLSSSNRTAGSHQYAASVKSLITILRDKKDKNLYHYVQEKHNLGPEPVDLAFRFGIGGIVEWEKVEGVIPSTKEFNTQLFLKENLVTPQTPAWCIKASGVSSATVHRARAHLGKEIETINLLIDQKWVAHWIYPCEANSWGTQYTGLSSAAPQG